MLKGNKLRDDMKAILKQLAYDIHIQIEHLEVMPDHVHMMLSFPPNMTPSDVVKNLKGSAARLWFKQHPETKQLLYGGHLWSPSYFLQSIILSPYSYTNIWHIKG